jgi:hypothetical protein
MSYRPDRRPVAQNPYQRECPDCGTVVAAGRDACPDCGLDWRVITAAQAQAARADGGEPVPRWRRVLGGVRGAVAIVVALARAALEPVFAGGENKEQNP